MDPIAITGFGSYLPKLMHTNQTLPPLDEPLTADELQRIGVFRRGWARDGEGIAEMAAAAGRRALERANLRPEELDLIVLANWTQRRYIPEFAPKLKNLLGAPKAIAYDVCCACAGFIYGLGMAHSFLQNPRFKKALVVASETTSQRARPGSKGTVILGDAAGSFVLERGVEGRGQLLDYELSTDGDQHHIMDVSPEGWVRTHITQKELNALAGKNFAMVIGTLLKRNHLTLGDVAWIIPHSGTAGVQAMVQKTLEAPPEKILTNYAQIGNVSSASIPAALDQFVEEGKVKRGDLIISAAVGTGWYSAGMLYRV
ncbi:MAG: ketoacyl-ACP synthase III [Myxococcaceae bacterium]